MFECIDRWIDRLEGVYQPPRSADETLENTVQALLAETESRPCRVAVVSTLHADEPARVCAQLAERMSAHGRSACVGETGDESGEFVFCPCGGILEDSARQAVLRTCDQAILAETLKKSSLPRVRRVRSLLQDQNMNIIGVLLI